MNEGGRVASSAVHMKGVVPYKVYMVRGTYVKLALHDTHAVIHVLREVRHLKFRL